MERKYVRELQRGDRPVKSECGSLTILEHGGLPKCMGRETRCVRRAPGGMDGDFATTRDIWERGRGLRGRGVIVCVCRK